MDVKCENCNAEYALDETLVAATGTSVRCTKCGQIFNVFSSGDGANQSDKWLLRQVGGETYSFDHIGVLQQWIAKGKVSPDDLLVKEGQDSAWKRIGDIREMQSFFSLVDSPQPVRSSQPIASRTSEPVFARVKDHTLTGTDGSSGQTSARRTLDFATPTFTENGPVPSAAPVASQPSPSPTPIEPRTQSTETPSVSPAYSPTPPAGQLDLSQIPASEKSEWNEGREVVDAKGPAWAEKKRETLPKYPTQFDSLIPSQRKTGRWIVLLVILALVASGAAFFVMTQQNIGDSLNRLLDAADDNRHRKFFDRGYEYFLLDSASSYRQADREFQKALALKENDALTQAALAEMYAVWAQYYRDAETDEKVDLSTKEALTEMEHRQLERRYKSFNERLFEALRWGKLAMKQNPVPPEAHRAMADIMRLAGNPTQARQHLEKARENGSNPETEYVAVLLDQDAGKPDADLLEKLALIIKEKPLIRAMYRRARMFSAQNENVQASRVLQELFELNSEHGPGLALRDRIDANKPVLLAAAPLSENVHGETTKAVSPSVGQEKKGRDPVVEGSKKPSRTRSGDATVDIDAILIKAKRAQERGKTKSAMKLYDRVLETSPSNIDALSGLAYCHLDLHSHGRAIATFRRVLEIQPSFGPAVLGLAETYKSQRQNKQAVKYYSRYLDTNPDGRYAGMAKRNLSILREEIASQQLTPPAAEPPVEKATATSHPAETTKTTAIPSSDTPKTPQ